jgi:hypothetical protein
VRAGVTGLLPLLVLLLPARAQDSGATAPVPALDEGPLQNDCFLPVSEAASEALDQGDLALAEGRPTDAFEAWRRALTASDPGDAVAPPAGSGEPAAARRTEAVECGVLRRLNALPPEGGRPGAAAFGARFEALAERELAAAGRAPAGLLRVERRNPATLAAATAALRLADLALEDGRPGAASAFLERARAHLKTRGEEFPQDDAVRSALARREAAIATLRAAADPTPAPWETARVLEWLGATSHLAGRVRLPPGPPELGRGVRPGLAFLDDGRAAVQTADRVGLIDPAQPKLLSSFVPADLVARSELSRPPSSAGSWTAPPGWPLLPATDGRDLVLVQGRWSKDAGGGNVLMCARPGTREALELGLPTLRWALREELWLKPDGQLEPHALLADLSGGEFQPGPVVIERTVLAQVRVDSGDVRAFLLALDLETGEPLWRRLLAKGVDLASGAGRFEVRARSVAAGQPLARLEGRVFAGTSLGAGVLVDASDGRVLWSLKNRRRSAGEPGWAGERPVVVRGAEGDTRAIVWTPPDSDRLYTLRADPDLDGAGPFAAPPLWMDEAEALVSANPDEIVLLSRAGPVRTVSTWHRTSGGRSDGVHLLPRETFTGSPLASATRVLACTEGGLYLFDRGRDLYLLQHLPLEGAGRDGGGTVYARGEQVLVVGNQMVWAFRALH